MNTKRQHQINTIVFDNTISTTKPETIINTDAKCPFCHPAELTDIIDTDGPMIFLKNKYNVLVGADQFVLIETDRCGQDIEDYSPAHVERLFRFGLKHFDRILADEQYSAGIFFKNHGPYSGGTISHAHMQIIGLRDIDPDSLYDPQDFMGPTLLERNGLILNTSYQPRLGFGEFNIICDGYPPTDSHLATLAHWLQNIVRFFKKYFPKARDSYNLFFYRLPDKLAIKAMPRFPTSPLFIGYDLRMLPKNLDRLAPKLAAQLAQGEIK